MRLFQTITTDPVTFASCCQQHLIKSARCESHVSGMVGRCVETEVSQPHCFNCKYTVMERKCAVAISNQGSIQHFSAAGHALRVQPAGPKIALWFPHLFAGLCIPTYHHVRNNYVTYIVAMQVYSSRLRRLLSASFCLSGPNIIVSYSVSSQFTMFS